MPDTAKSLHQAILDCLEHTDPDRVRMGLDHLTELYDHVDDQTALDSLHSSVVAQLASTSIASGKDHNGFAILYHLCLEDLTTRVWMKPKDSEWRDRHLGVVLDRHPSFVSWVEALRHAPPRPRLVLDVFPKAVWRDNSDRLLLLISGQKHSNFMASPDEDSFAPGRVGRMAVLLQLGAQITAQDSKTGTTPLHWLASRGDIRAIQYAVDKGANIQATDNEGETPLIYAAKSRAGGTVIPILFEAGARLSDTTSRGRTPLLAAACSGSGVGVTALVAKGADPNERGMNQSPLERAADSGNLEAVRALTEAGAERTETAERNAKARANVEVSAYFQQLSGGVPPGGALDAMIVVATELGLLAAISARESGDFSEYRRLGWKDSLLAEHYWESTYQHKMKQAIQSLPPESRAEFDDCWAGFSKAYQEAYLTKTPPDRASE